MGVRLPGFKTFATAVDTTEGSGMFGYLLRPDRRRVGSVSPAGPLPEFGILSYREG